MRVRNRTILKCINRRHSIYIIYLRENQIDKRPEFRNWLFLLPRHITCVCVSTTYSSNDPIFTRIFCICIMQIFLDSFGHCVFFSPNLCV